jgi:hypothetical protein
VVGAEEEGKDLLILRVAMICVSFCIKTTLMHSVYQSLYIIISYNSYTREAFYIYIYISYEMSTVRLQTASCPVSTRRVWP